MKFLSILALACCTLIDPVLSQQSNTGQSTRIKLHGKWFNKVIVWNDDRSSFKTVYVPIQGNGNGNGNNRGVGNTVDKSYTTANQVPQPTNTYTTTNNNLKSRPSGVEDLSQSPYPKYTSTILNTISTLTQNHLKNIRENTPT